MGTSKSKSKGGRTYRSIADITRISDPSIQAVLKEVEHTTLEMALKKASETVQDAFFRNMSIRAADIVRDNMDRLGSVKQADVAKARKHIVTVMNALCATTDVAPQAAPASPKKHSYRPNVEKARKKAAAFDLLTTPVEEIIHFMCDLADIAKRDGILTLEYCCDGLDAYPLMGFQLAVDGTDPRLVDDLLTNRKKTLLAEARRCVDIIRTAVLGISAGDNPRIIEEKCGVFTPKPVNIPAVEGEGVRAALDEALRRRPPVFRSGEQVIEIFVYLAHLARRQGILALESVLGQLDPLSRIGMTEVVDGTDPYMIAHLLDSVSARLLADLELRLDLVRISVIGIQKGDAPDLIRKRCRILVDCCESSSGTS